MIVDGNGLRLGPRRIQTRGHPADAGLQPEPYQISCQDPDELPHKSSKHEPVVP